MDGGILGREYSAQDESRTAGNTGSSLATSRPYDPSLNQPSGPSPQHNYVDNGETPNYARKDDASDFSTSPNYLDWALNMLLDQNHDLLGTFDFNPSGDSGSSGSIMQKIQYQNSVHDSKRFPVLDKTPSNSNHSPSTSALSQGQFNGQQRLHNQQVPSSLHQQNQGIQHQPQPEARAMGVAQEAKTKPRRPCDHCRRRKTKCVIVPGANNCVQCESKSLTCTYTQPNPRKDDADEPMAKRAKRSGLPSHDNGLPTEVEYLGQTLDIIPPNVPIRDVAPIQDYSMMNNSLLRKTLSLQFPRSSFYVGPTSYLFDNNLLDVIIGAQNSNLDSTSRSGRNPNLSKIEQINLSDSVSLRKVGDRTQFVLKDDQSKLLYQNMLNDVDAIEKFVAPHGQILIDLYFRIIHPLYPILHKKVFLEKYSRTHREFSAPLLAAVYVLAIHWWDYDPQLNRFPKPNVELILKIALNNYLLEILKRPKLSAVQAGLLLLQCKHIVRELGGNVGNPAHSVNDASALLSSSFNDSDYNDWVLCSQVVALSEELGLGLDCDHWKLPKWERGLRKRLAWAVYMEDKWLALKNARPSHISDMNWVVLLLVEEDFPEKHGDGDLKEGSSDINNGKKNFMNLIGLSRILSDIINSLYSMKAMIEVADVNEVLRIAKPIQLRLRNWYHSLPVELQMNSVQPRKLCSNGYLQLAYFAAELTLHRKIITVMHQLGSDRSALPKELISVCRTAAKTRLLASIEFVRDLKPEHIHSFWHSSSAANFTLIGTFAALLFVSSADKLEADFYKDQIFNYRWILKISSKGFVQVGDALQKLDLVLNHIPGLLNESADQPMVVPNVPTIDYNKAYKQPVQPQPKPGIEQNPNQIASQPTQPPLNLRYNSYGPPSNSQFMNNSGRPSPFAYNGNAGKGKEMTRPSSAQQYRMSQNNVQSPYDTNLAFNTPPYSAQSGVARGGHSAGANSPQSQQSLSPKEIVRQPKSTVAGTNPTRGSDQNLERRASLGSHNSDAASHKSNQSFRGDSPLMMRSPLANQLQPSEEQQTN